MPFRLLFYESSYISTLTMNSNKDFKGGIALAVLTLGTACTILALSTDHWYDVKMVINGYTRYNFICLGGGGAVPLKC